MNFLIIVYKGIGDVILMTPLIKVIKRNFENSKVFFLTRKYSADILKHNPYIDEVLIREDLSLRYLRGLDIDVAIDWMLSSSSAFYSLISGAKKRIAFWRDWGFIAYNCMIRSEWQGYNVIKRFEYLKPFGIDWKSIKDIKPEIYPSEEDFKKAKNVLINSGIDLENDKIVSFDITSPRLQRQPHASVFIYSADMLLQKGWKTIFISAPWDSFYIKSSIDRYSKYPNEHIVIDNLSLLELSALISYAKLHVGTSSAPMHIAVSFDVPTFTLYTLASDPISWTPPFMHHAWMHDDVSRFDKIKVWEGIERHIKILNL